MTRLPYLLLAVASLAAGVLAGLLRLGWSVPIAAPGSVPLHGALMVCGFFGTVIGLERAVALQRRWVHGWPLLAGISGSMIVIGAPMRGAASLAVVAAVLATLSAIAIVRRHPHAHFVTMLLGVVAWLIGNVLWLVRVGFSTIALWWMAFLVLTIAGERLELNRVLPPSPALKRLFGALVGALLLAAAAATLMPPAAQLFGALLAAIAGWLFVADIARRNAVMPGLTGFVAQTLLGGYAWLLFGGLALLVGGNGAGSLLWDAALHATLLGFVFLMVFAHAPIILPAVARLRLRYTPWFQAHVILLHASLALRVAGDLAGEPGWRAWGGAGNALALVLFVANTATAAWRGSRTR